MLTTAKKVVLLARGNVSAQAAAFLARTTGLDELRCNAYITLIDGLVADGVWAELDILYVFATADQNSALLNLKSTSYAVTLEGSPTFTTDRGFTCGAIGKIIRTNWKPFSNGVKYTQDSAHIGYWDGASAASFFRAVFLDTTNGGGSNFRPRDAGNNFTSFNINSNSAGGTGPASDASGHWILRRPDSNTRQTWRNGFQFGADSPRFSLAPDNFDFCVGGQYANPIRALHTGSGLTPTQISTLYSRLASYMMAIGASP